MSLSTTQYGYIVDPMVPFTDDKGKTIKNGFIRVFMAGTSTPVLTYRNYDGATNQEKIELDNSGRVKHNVIGSKGSLYKVVVYDAHHSQETPILTVDKIAVLGSSIKATGATIVTGLDNVTVPEENFLKATVEGTGVELALDPTEVTSEVSTTADAVTAGPDYIVPLLNKTGTGDSKKISLANLFKFALDWISRLATTVTSFASGDFIAVSNTTNGARKMSKDTLIELTAQNALAGNVAPAFDPTCTSENPYKAGEKVAYGGKTYIFKVDHYGAWDAADVRDYCITDTIDGINDDLLGITKNVQIGYSTATGYYYHASVGNSIASAIVESSGKYTPFGSALSPVGIDVSDYVGGVLKITMTDRLAGTRNSAITNAAGTVLVVVNDSDYMTNGDGSKSASVQIPVDSKYLFWSSHSAAELLSLEVSISGFGVEPRIEKIESEIPFTRPIEMTTTYANMSIDGEGIACGFTKSMSTKVSGTGGGYVEISIPERNYECGSIGIYFPWESQKVAQIYVYYDNVSQSALLRANYKSAVTGWVYYQQGNGFMRVNFPKGTKKLKLRIDTTDHDADPWEFYVSDNFVFNDDLPLAPVCIMYDGGAWEGKVVDNGVEMSLWQLHKKYNIPYGICVTEENYTLLNPEVAQDIANGFAHIVLRSADLIQYYNDTQDTQMAVVLNTAFTDVCADSRMLALAEHKLDPKIYRVAIQCGVEIVRTGPSNNYSNIFGQKFGDSSLFCIPSSRLGGTGGGEIQNYPIIIWEHGVGIPPEGWTGLNYVDPTGENTPLLFQWLHGLMEQGKAACLSPSDFIAYCKSH